MLQLSITVGADRGLVMMSMGADVAVTASMHNGTAWQPLPQLLSLNASLLLSSSAIKFRASVPDCNRALATLEYRSAAPISPSVHEIARITVIVNDMGNYGCYNDCSTAEPVPLLAVSTIVIVNYGWFSHKWLLLRPGVLLGVATGIGMLLIVMATVCAWLYLVNRLLSARGKVQKIVSSFGVADGVLLEEEGQQAQNSSETADDNYAQDEVQANRHLEYVATIDTYAKDWVPEDGVTADLHVDYCSQDVSGASNVISAHDMHDCAPVDIVRGANEAKDVITRDDYAQADFPVGATWHFSCDKGLPSEATNAPDLVGYVQSTDLLEKICRSSDTMQAIYDPDSTSDFQSTNRDGHFQITNALDHDLDGGLFPGNLKADGHTSSSNCHSTIAEEGIGFHDLDGYTLPCHLEAPDQQISPTNFTNELENTCMTNQIDGTPYSLPCELDYQVDKEGMQHLGSSIVSSVLESRERSRSSFGNRENYMPACLSSSLIDNRLNQQNVEDDQACNDRKSHSLESYGNTADDQSLAVELEAANRSQNEYPNQLDNEGVVINDLLSYMPFGDSSSSSQSFTSAEGGSANLERTMSIEPAIGMHGKLEEDGMCALNTYTINPFLNSHLPEMFEEETSEMPELRLVLELPETSSVDENMDPLDHINLVFSSLETDADGSLVAVLRQSN